MMIRSSLFSTFARRFSLVAFGVLVAMLAGSTQVAAQETSKVTVNLGKPLNIVTSTSLGPPMFLHNGYSFDPQTAAYLKATGLDTLRFPASAADLYHWSTDALTPYKGSDPPYKAPNSTFGNLAHLADMVGNSLIVVNYGSNLDGTGGGEPAEAAAWVAYANGDPSSSLIIGKDSTGHDWGTVAKWATLRGQAPLATDDGLNALRINHPASLNIKLWQIGDQVYNNGYYGGEHVGEPDLHGPAPTALKDFGKLHKNPKLSPAFYGDQIVEFAKAMKNVDPTIQIGAAFVTPPDGLIWAPDWNATVLKRACSAIDFETIQWITGKVMPPDWHTLDEGDLFANERSGLAAIFTGLLYDDKNNCPKGHTPRISFFPVGVINWAKVDHPIAPAIYATDLNALLVESGSINITTPDLYSDSMIANDRKKVGPMFIGLQMLHAVLHNPGDQLLDTSSSDSKLAVHAVKRRDGVFAMMLVNEDPSAPITAKINIAGGQVGSKGRRFEYGAAQQKTGAGIAPMEIKDVGNDFSVTVPPYTITAILIE